MTIFVKLLHSKHCKKLIDTLYWIEVYCGNLNMESISKESVSLYWEWEWMSYSQKQSSRSVLRKKVFWKYAANVFTGKHPYRSAISIKLQSNFIEITLWHGCSSVNLQHIFRISFLKNTSGRLLLYAVTYHYDVLPYLVQLMLVNSL